MARKPRATTIGPKQPSESTQVAVILEAAVAGTPVEVAGQPIYITRAIPLKGENLTAFLASKNVTVPDKLNKLLKTTSLSCEPLYLAPHKRPATEQEKGDPTITKDKDNNIDDSIILMMFELNWEEGLISTLAGDEALGKLFVIKGAKLRVLRCPASSRPVLKQYARQLSA